MTKYNAISLGAVIIFCLLFWIVVGALVCSLFSCDDDDGCISGDVRCDGDKLQVCDGSSFWETVYDCRKEFDERCCKTEDGDYDCAKECTP